MLNPKLARIHAIFSYAYFFFVGLGFLLIILGLIRKGDDVSDLGIFFIFFMGPIGLFHWYAGKGVAKGTTRGRRMSKGIAILFLFGFPIGTILGMYMLGKAGSQWEAEQPSKFVEN